MNSESYMKRCLTLAGNGMGRVAPNPMVGCVIVKDEKIIGEGYHSVYGGPHAEVNAINSVDKEDDLKESTLFVSLEPCSHHGKTPPCVELIIQKGIPRVVIAQADPNPLVAGKGIELLKNSGVNVESGILEAEAQELNRRFNTYHTKNRPYIILKWAMSSNGMVDIERTRGEKGVYWISSPTTKKLVHKWRAEEASILVGSGTVGTDNPGLDCRLYHGKDPLRVVLSGDQELPPYSKVLTDGKPTLVFGKKGPSAESTAEWIFPQGEDLIDEVLQTLYEKGINSVLVEGGPTTHRGFLDRGLWDEARVIVSKSHIPKGIRAPDLDILPEMIQDYGSDRIFTFRHR